MEDRSTAPKSTDKLVSTGPYTLPQDPVPRDPLGKIDPTGPMTAFYTMTAEQQIRAKALECAARYLCQEIKPSKDSFWATVEDMYNYIKEGK